MLDYCRRELARLRADAPELPFDFTGGFAGYFGYELKAELGGELVHRSPLPDATLLFCDRVIAFDHHKQRVHLVALADADGAPAAEAWLAATEARARGDRQPPALAAPPAPAHAPLRFVAREDREAYLANIAACKREIFEGESYEICLTTELHSDGAIEPRRRLPRPARAQPRAARGAAAPRRPVGAQLVARALPARRPRADGRVEADQGHRPRAPPTRSRTPTAAPRCATTRSPAPRTS